ncbi:hypothetical protein GOODEAATRI_009604 [Goodea atripinnis]|uniref:Uncharacterized protein n=1 Tax=Goodea atripinnis TaxID=208336 RepID=A0ABV0NAA1_9TELE
MTDNCWSHMFIETSFVLPHQFFSIVCGNLVALFQARLKVLDTTAILELQAVLLLREEVTRVVLLLDLELENRPVLINGYSHHRIIQMVLGKFHDPLSNHFEFSVRSAGKSVRINILLAGSI